MLTTLNLKKDQKSAPRFESSVTNRNGNSSPKIFKNKTYFSILVFGTEVLITESFVMVVNDVYSRRKKNG